MAKQPSKKREIEPLTVRNPRRAAAASKPLYEPPNYVAYGIFILITLLFFSPFLFGSGYLWEDFLEQFFPHEVFAARNFSQGVIPFWNPYAFCGMPFLADLQNGFFYPGNLLMYLFSGGDLTARLAQFFVVAHYLVAMIGAWKLARQLGIGQWGGIFSGIAWGLCGMMVAHMIHPNMIYHLAWFPFVLMFFHRGVTQRSWLHGILSGIILGLTMLSGHPQSALFMVFYMACFTLFLLLPDLRGSDAERKATAWKGAAIALLVVAIGAGIFAIQLLPAQELAGLSERAASSYEKSLEGSITIGHLVTLVVPKFFGVVTGNTPQGMEYWYRPETFYFWETCIYVGVVTLLLAAIGLASKRLGALRWFVAGMALFSLLYALGDSFFLHPIINKLPLFGSFRVPTRMMLFFGLGAALLAGVGLERAIRPDDDGESPALMRTTWIAGGIIVLIGLLSVSGVLGGMFNAPAEVAKATGATGITPILIGLGAVAVLWAGLKRKMPGAGVAVALLLLGTIDLFIFGAEQNPSPNNPEQIYQRNDEQFAMLKAQAPDRLFRVKMRESGAMLMQRNQGPYSQIMLFEGYNPLLLARRVPPAQAAGQPGNYEPAYDLMNIRYAVRVDAATRSAGLAERPTAFPHARMLYDYRVADTAAIKKMLGSGEIDLSKTVLLEKEPSVKPDGTGSGTATISHYDPARIEVGVKTDKAGILLLSEVWYPAWHVYVDGAETELLTGDYSLRAIAVPAGNHTVELRFESSAYSTGKWITIATLLLSIGGAVAMGVRKKRGTTPQVAAGL